MRNRGQIWMLLVLLALVCPLGARADKGREDALAQKAKDAAAAGRVFESRDAYCQLAQVNANYPQATMMCSIMKKEADREEGRCDQRFSDGSADLNTGKYDDAEQKLRNVKQGCKKYDEARQLMARIPELKSKGDQDKVANQRFEEGSRAYNSNNFAAAKSALGQVPAGTGRANDAQALLNKIKQYEQAMAEGDRLFASSNFSAARNNYQEAAKLKSDGPGDPSGKIQRANESERLALANDQKRKEEEACRAKKPVFTVFQVSATNGQVGAPLRANVGADPGCKAIAGTLIQWGDGAQSDGDSGSHAYKSAGTYDVTAWVTDEAGNKVSRTQTVRIIEAAVKQVVPEVNVEKTLAEARAAKQKGDIRLARGKYMTVLSADKGNREALAALDELSKMAASTAPPKEPEPQTPGVISEADALLGKGITEFYTAQFDDAIFDLRTYLQFKGEKVGLANFYIGAVKATQYHLAGASDPKYLNAAVEAFRAAKKSPKFKVPEKYVSPKIMEMFNSAGM